MTELTQAQRLIAALPAAEIENILVVFSLRGGKLGHVTVGTTAETPMLWTLGAMDYARWNFYETLSMHRVARDMALAQATAEVQELQEHGIKPS